MGIRFLDMHLIGLSKDLDGVVQMAENPEIVAADVGKLLQIELVDVWAVQGINELVGQQRDL